MRDSKKGAVVDIRVGGKRGNDVEIGIVQDCGFKRRARFRQKVEIQSGLFWRHARGIILSGSFQQCLYDVTNKISEYSDHGIGATNLAHTLMYCHCLLRTVGSMLKSHPR